MATAKLSMYSATVIQVRPVAIVLLLNALTAERLFVQIAACGAAVNHSVSGAVIITRQIRARRSLFKANIISCQLLFVARPEYLGKSAIAGVVSLFRQNLRYRPRTNFLLQPLDGSLRLQIRVRISYPHNSVTSLPALVFHPNQVAGSHSPR
jgi:hypothetical protein